MIHDTPEAGRTHLAPDAVVDEYWAAKLRSQTPSAAYVPGNNLRTDAAVRLLSGGRRLLDVGCGFGVLCVAVNNKYAEVYGVDIAEEPLVVASAAGVRTARVDLNTEPLPFANGSFDAVTMMSVLPYIYDVKFALAECRRILRDGGQFVISVANMRSLGKLYRLAVQGQFPTTTKVASPQRDGGAMHYFCSADLREALQNAGFRIRQESGIFCRPRFLDSTPDVPSAWCRLKREFFSGELLFHCTK